MRHIRASIEVNAAADGVWRLLTEFDQWPKWGPTVVDVESEAATVAPGVTGRASGRCRSYPKLGHGFCIGPLFGCEPRLRKQTRSWRRPQRRNPHFLSCEKRVIRDLACGCFAASGVRPPGVLVWRGRPGVSLFVASGTARTRDRTSLPAVVQLRVNGVGIAARLRSKGRCCDRDSPGL